MEGGGGRGCNFVFGHREWVPLCVVTRASHEWRRECAVLISVFHNYAPAAPHSSPRGCNVLAEPVLRAIRVGVVASSTFNCFVEILLPRFSKNQVSKSNCVFCSFFFFFACMQMKGEFWEWEAGVLFIGQFFFLYHFVRLLYREVLIVFGEKRKFRDSISSRANLFLRHSFFSRFHSVLFFFFFFFVFEKKKKD